MKRGWNIFFGVLLAVSLSACGGGGGTVTDEDITDEDTTGGGDDVAEGCATANDCVGKESPTACEEVAWASIIVSASQHSWGSRPRFRKPDTAAYARSRVQASCGLLPIRR